MYIDEVGLRESFDQPKSSVGWIGNSIQHQIVLQPTQTKIRIKKLY